MNNIIALYKKYRSYSEEKNAPCSVGLFCYWIFLRLSAGIGITDYVDNALYNHSISHNDFYSKHHVSLHKWKNVSRKFKPDGGKCWFIIHYVDYFFARLVYPGLDAMDYFRYEFYNYKHNKRKTFITEGGVKKMDRYFNGKSKIAARKLTVKTEFNEMFSDFIYRRWISSYKINEKDFIDFSSGLDKVIAKPIDGGGGKGIYILNLSSEEDRKKAFLDLNNKKYIIEEVINQHPTLSSLNPYSVNTVRVYSVYSGGEVYITGAALRIGSSFSCTDNYSTGGLVTEIDVETGLVISRAVSQAADAFYIHPKTGVPIIGTQIPCWDKVKETVKKAHKLITELGYIGWDVVVCEDSSITFIEANTCSGVELQQHAALIGKKKIYERFMHKNNDS